MVVLGEYETISREERRVGQGTVRIEDFTEWRDGPHGAHFKIVDLAERRGTVMGQWMYIRQE